MEIPTIDLLTAGLYSLSFFCLLMSLMSFYSSLTIIKKDHGLLFKFQVISEPFQSLSIPNYLNYNQFIS